MTDFPYLNKERGEADMLKKGDVVQINPEHHKWFAACFAVVEEVTSWGCKADVYAPGTPPGIAPMRLETGSFVRVGESTWLLCVDFDA